jgi:hypothetical protein
LRPIIILRRSYYYDTGVRDNQSEENDNLNKVIHDIETELVKIYDQKAKGAQIRCLEKWVEYG